MQKYASLEVLRSMGTLVPFNKSNFDTFVLEHTDGLSNQYQLVKTISDEVELTAFNGMSVDDLLESAILAATQNIQNNIDFDKLAARIQVSKIYYTAIKNVSSYDSFDKAYKDNFVKYIKYSVQENLLNSKLTEIFENDLEELSNEILIENDDLFKFVGISTALKRYMKTDWKQNPIETPQYMWMRIAMWMAIKEENPVPLVKQFYKKLSAMDYIPGGSTNIGAGTNYPVLSNCYLVDVQDDINSIFDNVKNVALISKATGGIGIAMTKLRAEGSPVKTNNTFSTGPIPFIKVMDTALKSVSRAGKKYGAVAFYMENWHLDFQDFVDLKQNAGDDYRRIRVADTAVYISDEFMKRVVNNQDWYLFDPYEVSDLTELYGNDFSKRYEEYIEMAEKGQLRTYKKLPAREQMKTILISLMGTSHPWLTWKDTINLRALNNNSGTIHCSNLCTEICLPQDKDNIAVCNLLYLNLVNHVKAEGKTIEEKIDWELLEDTVRVGVRHLDNLVDVNELTIPEAQKSDSENRAVGMGMSGFAETLELFGYSYDSEEGFLLMDRLMEFITYHAIDESCNIAEVKGSYANFEGSMWSKGFVPFDTIDKVSRDRLGKKFDEKKAQIANSERPMNERDFVEHSTGNPSLDNALRSVREKIQDSMSNTDSKEHKDLLEIFSQITQIVSQNASQSNQSSNNLDSNRHDLLQPGEGIELTQDRSFTMNWDKLREKVKRGIRNATLMAIAPNASTGLVLGTTPGFDPRFANIFSRNTSRGKYLDINDNLVRDLIKLDLWDTVKDRVIENYGDISEISEIPQEIRSIYKTSFQVSPYAYIEVASRAQKWIDQAISRNMYLDTRDVDEMIDIYTDAWRRGLKTTYYLHVKPRHQAEQSSIKVNKGEKLSKAGFAQAAVSTQETLDGSNVKKGFGFAEVKPVTPEEEPIKAFEPVAVTEEVRKSEDRTFGFGSQIESSDEDLGSKANFSEEPKPNTDKFWACPIDPAERANCEACM